MIWDLSMLCLTPYLNIKFSWHFEIRADCAYELFSPRHSHKIDLVNFIFLLAKICSLNYSYSWNISSIFMKLSHNKRILRICHEVLKFHKTSYTIAHNQEVYDYIICKRLSFQGMFESWQVVWFIVVISFWGYIV